MCRTIMVGIAGGTCAGKTHLANRLIRKLRSSDVSADYLALDWYYRDLSHLPKPERDRTNFDHPEAIDAGLFYSHLKRLKQGARILAPSYDYVEHVRLGITRTVVPADVLAIEGLFLLTNQAWRDMLDVGAFLNVPDDIRLIRRVRRDVMNHGLSLEYVLSYYETTIKPMHDSYVIPTAKYADVNLEYWKDQAATQALLTLIDLITEKTP